MHERDSSGRTQLPEVSGENPYSLTRRRSTVDPVTDPPSASAARTTEISCFPGALEPMNNLSQPLAVERESAEREYDNTRRDLDK